MTRLLLALSVLAVPLAAQQPGEATRATRAVDSTTMKAHLEFLANDLLEGRKPGTRGGELAALYLKTQFERLGLEPAGDSGTYYHHVPIISLTPSPTLSVQHGGSTETLSYMKDYMLWSMHDTTSVSASGELVYVGYGIVAPEYNWNDYDGVDVKGKIVVTLVNDPGLQDSTIFRGSTLTYYGRWTYKIEEAERQGAAGILMIHTDESATYPWSTVSSSWSGPQIRVARPSGPLVVAGWVTHDAAAQLMGGATRLDSLTRAAARAGFKPVSLDASASASVESRVQRTETDNVVARLPGHGPHKAEAVLIGGHYDHFGISTPVNGDSIYNGAEDNASGTAAVLAVAEAMVRSGVRPDRSIVFIGFAAEEAGLLGSTAFAARPTLPIKNIAGVLNMDVMNLHGASRDVGALGLDQSSLGATFREAARAEGLSVAVNPEALRTGAFFRSDHFPFARAGVPALSIEGPTRFVGKSAAYAKQVSDDYTAHRYHQPSDEVLPSFDYAGAVQQMKVITRAALMVANAAGMPTWSPESEFKEAGEARMKN
ncbi:MAG TPA: M20/M25/M40 family metallo-hydrolase [Gemmatimonadales bacterium]|nr:M20/M25/M40 family metallo-hydrolase [Gemmatimonadales bacterium]